MIKLHQGFTLIEAMITVAIIAIITSFAAPSFSSVVAKKRLETSARELAATLNLARSQAIWLRKQVAVKFESEKKKKKKMYWTSKHSDINLINVKDDTDNSDVVFNQLGIPQQRTKMVPNKNYDSSLPTDLNQNPPLNPPQVQAIVPLKFELCHSKIKESRIVSITLNGTIENISSGVCS